MKYVAFDSKDYKRTKKSDDGIEHGFYSPLGVGIVVDDYDAFKEAYMEATVELCADFQINAPMCLYSSSMLKNEIGNNPAIPFAQKLIDRTSKYISKIHFSYMVLPPKKFPSITVGGEKTGTQEIETEKFLRNLGPMFSYISAWNYWRYRRNENHNLIIDAFSSKETYAWRNLSESSELTVVSHGDKVHPMISYADLVAYMTDIKLYRDRLSLKKPDLESIWRGVFSVETTYIDITSISSVRWLNDNHINYLPYLQKPTVFFIADDDLTNGINSEYFDGTKTKVKKSKRMMNLQPVKNAIKLATLKGCSFRFYDPILDERYVSDDDIIVYMGHKSKRLAEYLEDGHHIEVLRARDVKNKLKGLQDN